MKIDLRKLILISFIFSGATALIYEITWIRPLQFLLGSTTHTISIIFAAFMIGLSLGSWIISKYADRIINLTKSYAMIEIGIGLYGVLLLSIFELLPKVYNGFYFLHNSFYLFQTVQFLLVFIVILIPTTLMGATFPIVAKYYANKKVGKSVGEVYSANNLGAIVGSFSGGFILIPILGIKYSIILAGSVNLLLGFTILICTKDNIYKKIIPVVIILFIASAYIGDYSIKELYSGKSSVFGIPQDIIDKTEFLYYEEGLHGTVSVIKDAFQTTSLLINGKGQGGLGLTDLRIDYLLSYLSALLNPEAKNALVIGFGTGATSGHLSRLVKTTTVEIEPRVLETVEYFSISNLDVLSNPTHVIEIDDGRNYLLKSKEKYDIIVQQSSDPWQSFSTNLFSREYFELVSDSLNEDGIYLDWAPIYAMSVEDFKSFYKTFNSVFPEILVFANIKSNENIPYNSKAGELVFVGSKKKIDYVNKINNYFELLPDYSKQHLMEILIDDPEDLLNLFMFSNEDISREYTDHAEFITDDNLKLEFSTSQKFLQGGSPENIIFDIDNEIRNNKLNIRVKS